MDETITRFQDFNNFKTIYFFFLPQVAEAASPGLREAASA
jgi:hypothetical protein